MTALIGLLLLLSAASGTAVVLSRKPRRQVLAMSVNGQVLALLFMVLQAPDVAFSELTVGAAVLPLMFLVMLASTRMDRPGPVRDEDMTGWMRRVVFICACLALLPAIWKLAIAMPVFGNHALPYADLINAAAPAERHVTNMVSAVNFDYRGFDTIGEESMLVCAVTGTTILLRGNRGEGRSTRPGRVRGRPIPPRSEATLLAGRLVAPLTILFGAYVALHAMTTPGGGFQGGVIIASGLLLLFLTEGYAGWRRLMPSWLFDGMEGSGVALYALSGFAALPLGLPFLTNILPCGELRSVFSGGLMIVENLGVALAVTGGFMVLMIEFLEETRAIEGAQE